MMTGREALVIDIVLVRLGVFGCYWGSLGLLDSWVEVVCI